MRGEAREAEGEGRGWEGGEAHDANARRISGGGTLLHVFLFSPISGRSRHLAKDLPGTGGG